MDGFLSLTAMRRTVNGKKTSAINACDEPKTQLGVNERGDNGHGGAGKAIEREEGKPAMAKCRIARRRHGRRTSYRQLSKQKGGSAFGPEG